MSVVKKYASENLTHIPTSFLVVEHPVLTRNFEVINDELVIAHKSTPNSNLKEDWLKLTNELNEGMFNKI